MNLNKIKKLKSNLESLMNLDLLDLLMINLVYTETFENMNFNVKGSYVFN